MAVPALDGNISNIVWAGTNTSGVKLTTTLTNDVIVVLIGLENVSGVNHVTSVTASGLVFSKRFAQNNLSVSGTSNVISNEVWWAPAASTFSAIITVNSLNNVDDGVIVAFGVSGCANINSPWDTKVSLPASNSSAVNSNPTITFSTALANDFTIVGAVGADNVGEFNSSNWTGAGSNTFIDGGFNNGGVHQVSGAAGYAAVAGVQTNLTVTPVATNNVDGWILYGDALTATPVAAAATGPPLRRTSLVAM